MNKTTFGITDYINMFRSRGVRLVISYFFQNHLFDLSFGTDTHRRVSKNDYKDTPENLVHGVLYMSSWTNIIQNSTKALLKCVEIDFPNSVFLDLGCGKGKVLCVWSRMFKSYAEKPALVGVEYSEHLLSVCKSNLQILKCENVKLFHSDVLAFSFDDDFVHRIIYLYNPFDEVILQNVLLNLRRSGTFIIYNPVFDELFRELGFKRIKDEVGWHPNSAYSIYEYT